MTVGPSRRPRRPTCLSILARLRDRQFFSLGELNRASRELLVAVTRRPFQKLDASRRARALLTSSGMIVSDDEQRGVNSVLNAAALTYVSASLLSLLNIARWWAILRR